MSEDRKQAGPSVPQFVPLIALPSGAIISIDKLTFIARQEINKYAAFYANMGTAAVLTREDVDTLIGFGVIQTLRLPEGEGSGAAADVPKLIQS